METAVEKDQYICLIESCVSPVMPSMVSGSPTETCSASSKRLPCRLLSEFRFSVLEIRSFVGGFSSEKSWFL